MMQRGIVAVSLAVLMSFAVACNYGEDNGEVEFETKLSLDDLEIYEVDSGWSVGELVKDSTWTVENITSKPYPKLDNQITFIGDYVIRLDFGGVAAIGTSVNVEVSPITCRLLSGAGGGLIMYSEFERGNTPVSFAVHVLVDSVNEMTWAGAESISILRRVGDYCWEKD